MSIAANKQQQINTGSREFVCVCVDVLVWGFHVYGLVSEHQSANWHSFCLVRSQLCQPEMTCFGYLSSRGCLIISGWKVGHVKREIIRP